MIESITPEPPTEPPCGDAPAVFQGLEDAITPGVRREVTHKVTSKDFMILIPDPANVQFALADDGMVIIYFTYSNPEILKLKFSTQAEARRAAEEFAKGLEKYHD